MSKQQGSGCAILAGYLWAIIFIIVSGTLFMVFPPLWFLWLPLLFVGIWPLHKAFDAWMPTVEPATNTQQSSTDDPWDGIPAGAVEEEE